eukprot:8427784-Lingulodinium_polyedra.AAC.1
MPPCRLSPTTSRKKGSAFFLCNLWTALGMALLTMMARGHSSRLPSTARAPAAEPRASTAAGAPAVRGG